MQTAVIHVIGRIGKDPEYSTTPTGKSITRFTVAVSTVKGQNKNTTWFDVTSWFKLSDYQMQNLKKGNTVSVIGKFEKTVSEYNGKNYEHLSINAMEIQADGIKEQEPSQPELPNGDIPF